MYSDYIEQEGIKNLLILNIIFHFELYIIHHRLISEVAISGYYQQNPWHKLTSGFNEIPL